MPKDIAAAKRVVGAMSAIQFVGERLTLVKAFAYWPIAPEARVGFLSMMRESAKTLAELADDLEKAWEADGDAG